MHHNECCNAENSKVYVYSHLIAALFTPPWLRQHRCTRHRRGQHEGLLTHVQSLPMGACGLYGRPPQPRTPRDTKARSPDHPNSSTIAHRARRAGSRATHTQPHQHCDLISTQTCGEAIATAVEAALMMALLGPQSCTLPAHSHHTDGECCARQIGRMDVGMGKR
jgi:hypothetical protein